MPDLKEKSIAMLANVSAVDMHGTTKAVLYTVPLGKVAYITDVIVYDPSDSLAGGTSYAFGTGTGANTWATGVNLSGVTTASTGFAVVRPTSAAQVLECGAGSEFGIKATTGATADPCTVKIAVFGWIL